MNRFCMKVFAALWLLVLFACGALAQETMLVYVGEDAMDAKTAQQMISLLGGEFPQAKWALTQEGENLRSLVLSDRAPALAICAPQEALPWAKEGLLVSLQTMIGDQTRMQRQVLGSCVLEENLFMAPLIARHRQMAVNRALLEQKGLGYMLDRMTYPVWYPAQMYQMMEEFLLAQEKALDVWPAEPQTSAAIEALVQAIFGGLLVSQDGTQILADSLDVRGGVRWLKDMVEDELIGYCESREAALDRFVSGETAIFIDWTAQEDALEEALEKNGVELMLMPYPSSTGLPVRSFELTGVSAFKSGETERDALAAQAAALLHEQAQLIWGSRGIWRDHAVWLHSLDANDRGATLRSLLCTALTQIMEEGELVEDALGRVQAAMDAYK